jgi:hypothetical protein
MIEHRRVPMAESGGAAMAELTPPQKFLGLLAARDFESLAAVLASHAHARFLLPHGLEEYAGRDAIVRRIESWFGSASVFDLTSSSEEVVAFSCPCLRATPRGMLSSNPLVRFGQNR